MDLRGRGGGGGGWRVRQRKFLKIRHGMNSISTNTVLSSGIAERRRTEKKNEKKREKYLEAERES